MTENPSSAAKVAKTQMVTRDFLLSFVLVTILFPLWGFANDITNPMVRAFPRCCL